MKNNIQKIKSEGLKPEDIYKIIKKDCKDNSNYKGINYEVTTGDIKVYFVLVDITNKIRSIIIKNNYVIEMVVYWDFNEKPNNIMIKREIIT